MKLTFDKFTVSNEVHNYLYDYTKYTDYNSKVNISCKKHGEFNQLPNNHLKGSGCPVCESSKGELKVIRYLKEKKITTLYCYCFKN